MKIRNSLWLGLVVLLALAPLGTAWGQKYGGTLQYALAGNPPSLSIHDEATIYTVAPVMPAYNNLVVYDPMKAKEAPETIIADLATDWRWSSNGTELTFNLRRGVTFHDGKPFTAKDVKYTFDIVRGASKLKTKLSPRKLWYANVKDIVTNGDHEVTFKLGRPQPSLLAMLAAGVSPVHPAHVPPREWRTSTMGTGPFMLKEYKRDQFLLHVKNPNYWRKDRPYLDGVRYVLIRKTQARLAALAAKQVDMDHVSSTIKPHMITLKSMAPGMEFNTTTRTSYVNILFNTQKPPFNNPKLRLAVNLAMSRPNFVKSVFDGGAVAGGINLPPPDGNWGLTPEQVATLPGYGDDAANKAKARQIMAELGYSAEKPLKVPLIVRAVTFYVDSATWIISQLKEIWIDAEMRQVESGVLYGILARRDFLLDVHSTGVAADDPDVHFFEGYSCDSQRNYSDYCNPEVEALYVKQSQMFDNAERLKLVREIDERLVRDGARIVFGFRNLYNARWPYVKDLVPHQTHYSYARMQDVWLDK